MKQTFIYVKTTIYMIGIYQTEREAVGVERGGKGRGGEVNYSFDSFVQTLVYCLW
jgi:hypothetical protein